MIKYRAFALGAMIGLVGAMVPSCSPATMCSAANCGGCCGADGKCVASPNNKNNNSCGTSAAACVDCSATGATCDAASFKCVGGSNTGGGAQGGGTNNGGGTGGGNTCTGCVVPGTPPTCIPAGTSATSTTTCGLAGATCAACQVGELCTNGTCMAPAFDGGTGKLGEACNTDSDCHLPPATGFKAFCKKTMAGPSRTPYQGGYCTRRCLSDDVCGTGNLCVYIGGIIGELENICLKGCTSTADCTNPVRDHYECTDLFSGANDPNTCIPTQPDGTQLDISDAGPAAALPAGSNCTTDSQCGSTSSFACITDDTGTDAGFSGWEGGSCTGDCSLRGGWTTSTALCGGGNSVCAGFAATDNTGRGNLVAWECEQSCKPDGGWAPGQGQGGCRHGYICNSYWSGICRPDCRFGGVQAACASGRSCNMYTGQCETNCTTTSCTTGTCNATSHICEVPNDCRSTGVGCGDGGTCDILSGICGTPSMGSDAGIDGGSGTVDAGSADAGDAG